MILIGERINSTREDIKRALTERDGGFILEEARRQDICDYLDVNASLLMEGEGDALRWLVETIQGSLDKPLSIDTPSPQALLEAIRVHRGRAIVNSISAQRERIEGFLPILEEFKPRVIALLMDDEGIPDSAEGRLGVAKRIAEELIKRGFPPQDIFFDPIIKPISVEPKAGIIALETIELLKREMGDFPIVIGLSNISFGLPRRRLINRAFLVLSILKGLDAAILDPCDRELVGEIMACEALLGRDEYGMEYIRALREGKF